MNRQDYELIAATLAESVYTFSGYISGLFESEAQVAQIFKANLERTIETFATNLEQENYRFDEVKFREAVESHFQELQDGTFKYIP